MKYTGKLVRDELSKREVVLWVLVLPQLLKIIIRFISYQTDFIYTRLEKNSAF